MPPGDALRLSLDTGLDALEDARHQLLAHLGPAVTLAENRRAVYAMELVLEEWLTNVFRHGRCHRVELQATLHDAQLTLQFTDDGVPFDPTARPGPDLPANLDEARPGGLGLLFIRHYSKSWRYSRLDEHNVMQVVISFVAQPQSASAPPA